MSPYACNKKNHFQESLLEMIINIKHDNKKEHSRIIHEPAAGI